MKRFFTSVLIASATLLSVQAQEKITFKLAPEKGKVIAFEMNMKSDVEGTQNMIMDMTMKMNMSASDLTDSTVQYQTKYTQLKTDVNAGFISISYDSAIEPTDPMGKTMATQLKPLLDNTLTITMDRRAQVISMDFPNVPDAAFDRSSIQGMSVPYPTHPIAVGEKWENEIALPQLGVKGKNTNTFTGKTADGYKITVSGIYTDDSGKTLGTTSGYYIVDAKTFFTKASTISTELEVQGNKIKSSMELKEIQ
ncbi:DUF6263 family protein [Sphingobacterium yanglingense]|uniref:Uncharacterized protein n=1 Tax=Sphingobacterium yanglingense TaxID=1437280 RepID=A0A4R6W9Y9_9SPHI|nr:DUF6263 family protein [Sphingobacterium yanglingense]TDQ76031.1 hypothetical protein CLV99_3729 [Sphingobacterium yanglingense]